MNTTSTQPSIHLEDEEVHSFGGEWRDSWRLERSGNGSHAKEKKKAKRRRNRTNRKLGGNRMREVEPDTIAVMFVEHTGNFELAKRLQKAEDEMSKTTGFRIRITEMAGSQLTPTPGLGVTVGEKTEYHADRVERGWRTAEDATFCTIQAA